MSERCPTRDLYQQNYTLNAIEEINCSCSGYRLCSSQSGMGNHVWKIFIFQPGMQLTTPVTSTPDLMLQAMQEVPRYLIKYEKQKSCFQDTRQKVLKIKYFDW
jgi:hypothetical protein